MPDWTKLIQAKLRRAAAGEAPSPPSGQPRIPPGQRRVDELPVLDLGTHPDIPRETWTLRLFGAVRAETTLSWRAFMDLPQVTRVSDFHCVTHWSALDVHWEGVAAADVLARVEPLPEARFVTLHGGDGYTTNLPLETLLDDDVLLAHTLAGKDLPREHGGPVRLVVPKRYAWKSAKWLTAIEFHAEDRPGFWEARGYHNDADPWREERYSGA